MYGKHFAQTYTGSMFGAGPVVFALWGYVIANTRRDGTVELNTSLVAAILGAELEQVNAALAYLTSPDTKSRSKEFDGRRLLPLGEYLYQVPNYQRFNSMRNDDERREYNRLKQQESRKRRSKNVKLNVSHSQPPSAHIPVPVTIPVEGEGQAATLEARLTPEGQSALTGLLRAARNPNALLAEVRMILDGGRPNVPSDPAAVSLALHDLVVNGGVVTAQALRRFVQKAAQSAAEQTQPAAGHHKETEQERFERETQAWLAKP